MRDFRPTFHEPVSEPEHRTRHSTAPLELVMKFPSQGPDSVFCVSCTLHLKGLESRRGSPRVLPHTRKHPALTLLFLHTCGPGHTGRSHHNCRENLVPQPCLEESPHLPLALASRFPTDKTCPSTPFSNLSLCLPIHPLTSPPIHHPHPIQPPTQ